MKQILLAFSMLLAGCATQGSVESRPLSDGATRAYSAPVETVADAVRKAIPETGLNLKTQKRDVNNIIIMADRGVTGWSYGEIVRVAVIPHAGKSVVRIVSDRAFTMNVTAKDFTEDLFTHIGQNLGEYP